MLELASSIRERHLRVLDRIADSARRSGRPAESVKLVVVTKAQPLEVVQAAVEAGIRVLGENYADEAVGKIEAMRQRTGIEWHMVGHVQSRKAGLVAQHFALVHSLDSLRLARRLDRAAGALQRRLPVLLEVNVSGEETKYGWPGWNESRWADLAPELEAIAAMAQLKVSGLMTMPPLARDPQAARIYFSKLRRLREFLGEQIAHADWSELSMGTSADYQTAIEEGATLVRVGQAVLGPRPEAEVK